MYKRQRLLDVADAHPVVLCAETHRVDGGGCVVARSRFNGAERLHDEVGKHQRKRSRLQDLLRLFTLLQVRRDGGTHGALLFHRENHGRLPVRIRVGLLIRTLIRRFSANKWIRRAPRLLRKRTHNGAP